MMGHPCRPNRARKHFHVSFAIRQQENTPQRCVRSKKKFLNLKYLAEFPGALTVIHFLELVRFMIESVKYFYCKKEL